jgi:hypothetical protein
LLGEEQVGSFDNVFEVRFSIRVDEIADIGDIDGFGSVDIQSAAYTGRIEQRVLGETWDGSFLLTGLHKGQTNPP